ncbi:MAG: Flp pilus assembly complex ATPase component TadA [Alphaproteobacteria bacterium]|nr:MAG: Flp pilus assembly complex ATPase component TadA [Alphaproteobacteria bacterium]
MGMPLRELKFMDIYIRLDQPGEPRYRPLARDMSNLWTRPLPEEFHGDCLALTQTLAHSNLEKADMAFAYDGMRFRVSHQMTSKGERWAILRRIKENIPTMESLSFAEHITTYLRQLGRRDGLIILSGATGHGKTTTCFSLLKDYLTRLGGVAITVEDPVEYALEGPCGDNGYCYQVQVDNEDWATPLKLALRWTPRFMMVGEVRSPRAAEQILRAATTGHLVLTTIHAGSIEESLMGLMHLAEQSMGRGAEAMLAAGLTGALHQTLGPSGPFLRYVITEEANNGDPVRNLIREQKVGMINTYIDMQIARLNTMASRKNQSPHG